MIFNKYWQHGRHWFSQGVNFPCYSLVHSRNVILYWMLIKYIVNITFGFKRIQIKWILVFVLRSLYIQTPIHRQSESMLSRTRINSARFIFLDITRRQAISPVAKFRHVLKRGFMIQRVIFVFTWKYIIDFYQMSLSQSESTF